MTDRSDGEPQRLLVVDAGNTNIVVGCMAGDDPVYTLRMTTDRSKTGDEYALELSGLLRLAAPAEHFSGAVVSSVVPEITGRLCAAVRLVTGCEPFLIAAGIQTNFALHTKDPASLGADLLADMAAAADRFPMPALIFDLGTATTLSVLDEGGSYIGGMIMAGPAVALEALAQRASQLSSVPLTKPDTLLGGCTADCLRAGAVYGHAAMMDGLAYRAQQLLGGRAASVIATGGLAKTIAPLCQCQPVVDEALTLRGLCVLWRLNR